MKLLYSNTANKQPPVFSQGRSTTFNAMRTIQITGTAQGLQARLSSLTFRLDNADYGQFPCCQTGTCKLFPRAMS